MRFWIDVFKSTCKIVGCTGSSVEIWRRRSCSSILLEEQKKANALFVCSFLFVGYFVVIDVRQAYSCIFDQQKISILYILCHDLFGQGAPCLLCKCRLFLMMDVKFSGFFCLFFGKFANPGFIEDVAVKLSISVPARE
jgi:hypothetical protein